MTLAPSKPIVAIGPATERSEAWIWVGADMADFLRRHFEIVTFDSRRELPRCDAAVFVKRRVPLGNLNAWRKRGVKILYMPIDYYRSAAALNSDWLPRICSAVIIHCERLRPFLQARCPNVWSIDHYNKMGLKEPAPFCSDGYILWVGHFHYVPFILKWAEGRRLPYPLKILTDHVDHEPSTQKNARRNAQRLGVSLSIRGDQINGHALVNWTRDAQEQLLSQAKAAIDIKGGRDNFHQFTKPPTKGQKYVMSGIPFAANSDSYTYEYFQQRRFDLAVPTDYGRWFSKEYYLATAELGQRLREELTLERVGQRLAEYIHAVLETGQPGQTTCADIR